MKALKNIFATALVCSLPMALLSSCNLDDKDPEKVNIDEILEEIDEINSKADLDATINFVLYLPDGREMGVSNANYCSDPDPDDNERFPGCCSFFLSTGGKMADDLLSLCFFIPSGQLEYKGQELKDFKYFNFMKPFSSSNFGETEGYKGKIILKDIDTERMLTTLRFEKVIIKIKNYPEDEIYILNGDVTYEHIFID